MQRHQRQPAPQSHRGAGAEQPPCYRGAALALKARVLLYAASPLFNGQNIEAGNPLTGYSSYDKTRWKLAADAARELINERLSRWYPISKMYSSPKTTVRLSSSARGKHYRN